MWWALFIRTGLPPRIAKRLLTARETAELRAYYERYPFDDEARAVPMAQHSALYANAHRDKDAEPLRVADFLPFRPAPEIDPDAAFDTRMRAFLATH